MLADERDDLMDKNRELLQRVEEMGNESKPRRNSITSDEDYGSVQEMKEHLKHTRQILI
jgi:hypothetical protein